MVNCLDRSLYVHVTCDNKYCSKLMSLQCPENQHFQSTSCTRRAKIKAGWLKIIHCSDIVYINNNNNAYMYLILHTNVSYGLLVHLKSPYEYVQMSNYELKG